MQTERTTLPQKHVNMYTVSKQERGKDCSSHRKIYTYNMNTQTYMHTLRKFKINK